MNAYIYSSIRYGDANHTYLSTISNLSYHILSILFIRSYLSSPICPALAIRSSQIYRSNYLPTYLAFSAFCSFFFLNMTWLSSTWGAEHICWIVRKKLCQNLQEWFRPNSPWGHGWGRCGPRQQPAMAGCWANRGLKSEQRQQNPWRQHSIMLIGSYGSLYCIDLLSPEVCRLILYMKQPTRVLWTLLKCCNKIQDRKFESFDVGFFEKPCRKKNKWLTVPKTKGPSAKRTQTFCFKSHGQLPPKTKKTNIFQ